MKKKIIITICVLLSVIAIIIGVFLFIAKNMGICGVKEIRKEELKNAKKYLEWIDDLKLLDNKNVIFTGFNDDDVIKINAYFKDLEELEDMIDRDNNFIKSNSDYFKAGQKRVLYKRHSAEEKYYFALSNTFNFKLSFMRRIKLDIPYTQDGLFRITCIYYEHFDKSINKENTEVFILDITDLYKYEYLEQNTKLDEYRENRQSMINTELIKEYSSLKYVVLLTDDKNDDYDLLQKNIKQACPNVTIYILDDSDEENSSNK